MKKILIFSLLTALVLSLGGLSAYGGRAAAQADLFSNCINQGTPQEICGPCASSPDSPVCKEATAQADSGENPVARIVNTTASILAVIAGIAAIIMIIYAGFTIVTSGGNAERVATGRRRIIYSAVGLIVIALAWALTRFITTRVLQ